MKLLDKIKAVFPSKGDAGWGWEWGSTTHPIIGHAIIGAPFAFAATGYMNFFGQLFGAGGIGFVIYSVYGGVLTVLLAAGFQEWSDQRAHMAIVAHHIKEEFIEGRRMRSGDTAVEFLEIIQKRVWPPVPEVWHGWDWKDFVGFAIGAQVGAVLAVIVL